MKVVVPQPVEAEAALIGRPHESRPLLQTSSDGWGEADLARLGAIAKGAEDVPGPVTVAVAVGARDAGPESIGEEDLLAGEEPPTPPPAGEAPGWRLVAVGDSDFATNGRLANAGNPTFLANTFNWLLERHKLLGIGAKKPEQVRLALTPGQLRGVSWLSLAGLPAVAIAAGVAVWFRRRR